MAVKAIVKALTDRSPHPRYLAGRDARMIARLRRLPDGVRDRLLLRALGVNQTMFATPPTADGRSIVDRTAPMSR